MVHLASPRNKPKTKITKPHVLLIGDPSTAKTTLSKFAISVTDGATSAAGSSSSKAGITAIALPDERTKEWRAECGPLVLAKETFFLDEFNNLSEEDQRNFQQAMSEAGFPFHKANLHIDFSVSAGIITTANPKY
jgi:replicative DNA helicase Mcm